MVNFPAVAPTSMDFTAPEFPVKTNTSLSGVASRRLFGNRGSRSVLSMNFDNLTDVVATEFLDAWNSAKGQIEELTIPSIVFNGASAALVAYISDGGDALNWHFAEPPQLQRVSPGISSISVTLEATRDF
jgi:hypothetical protein